MALPDVTERPSHSVAAWFVGKKQFAVFSNDHHGDGRIALVCAGTLEIQAMLVEANPDAYYVPPYVGHRGWLGVRLDKALPWAEVASIVKAAHAMCARPTGPARRRPGGRRLP